MFRKFVVILTILALSLFSFGCFTTKIAAPPGENVKMLSPTAPTAFKASHRNWYILWGTVALNSTDAGVKKIITENSLTEVRVTTTVTFLDGFIGIVLGLVSVGTATVIVEGNAGSGGSSRTAAAEPAPEPAPFSVTPDDYSASDPSPDESSDNPDESDGD